MSKIYFKTCTPRPLIRFARTEMAVFAATKHFSAGYRVLKVGIRAGADYEIGLSVSGLPESAGFSKWMAVFEEGLRV